MLHATLLALPVSAVIGSACAFFLWSLEAATEMRFAHPWLLYLLPLAGVVIAWMYAFFGRSAEAGTNLILEEIHEPRLGVPGRMGPLILLSTVVTHLFGGSAGREGTAVQIGGSVAGAFGRWLGLSGEDVALLLRVGIAAGFGGVFGTPAAGAIFAIEVLISGRPKYAATVPCVLAAFAGDFFCTAWGVRHVTYAVEPRAITASLLVQSGIVGLASGLASLLFVEVLHALHDLWRCVVRVEWLRPALGGGVVIGLVFLLGTRDYLGLGVVSPDAEGVSILSSFHPGGATPLSWWWKLLFTAVTLSSGFKGGEVTPMFFIGATLGNTLSSLVGGPTDLLAAAGFVAVFAAATRTPLACAVMGVELFGYRNAAALFVACYVAHCGSGRRGIYASQRRGPRRPVRQLS